MARKSLYVLKDNGALYAISKSDGHIRWRFRYGSLAASSPAYGHGTVYIVLLKRFTGSDGGRVVAVSAKDGHTRWSRKLRSRAESSPLLHAGGCISEPRARARLRRARPRRRDQLDLQGRWRREGRARLRGRQALLRLLRRQRLRAAGGRRQEGVVQASGGGAFGLRSANFYSTPAVAYGRVYLGNTDGAVYSFSTDNGALAWRHRTGSYIYASPAVAAGPGDAADRLHRFLRRLLLRAERAHGASALAHKAGGKISGSATVVGDIVYFSNLHTHTTTGLGVRTASRSTSSSAAASTGDLRRQADLPGRVLDDLRAAAGVQAAGAGRQAGPSGGRRTGRSFSSSGARRPRKSAGRSARSRAARRSAGPARRHRPSPASRHGRGSARSGRSTRTAPRRRLR